MNPLPKSEASNAAVAVQAPVIARIHALKQGARVCAGRAVRTCHAVKSQGASDLVFQSVKSGKPMHDNNILTRHVKPAARAVGLGFVNRRCLRTSHATWLECQGADVKDVQGQLRLSHINDDGHLRSGCTGVAEESSWELEP
jgi:integrase